MNTQKENNTDALNPYNTISKAEFESRMAAQEMDKELVTSKSDIGSMDMEELTAYVLEKGWPKFRAKQIYDWLHKKFVANAEEMKNLPKDMRETLDGDILRVRMETKQESKSDGTIKFLFAMEDGQMIETVFMRYKYGNSICISSQAGCPMGCAFCASTIGGWKRNLRPSEMLGQIYEAMRLTGERISNVVVMGTGEPFRNFDHLIRAIRLLTSQQGYNLSGRNITVSTCGVVPRIYELAETGIPITLALSLHAPTDEKRKTLMPVAHLYTIQETLDACSQYFEKTGRRVSCEYSLMSGINDGPEDAKLLGQLLAKRNFHVNLIPINPVSERDFKATSNDAVLGFKNTLEKYHINVTIRRSLGGDIDAACGQLRRKYEG